jgi:uncharacterized protein DUF5681
MPKLGTHDLKSGRSSDRDNTREKHPPWEPGQSGNPAGRPKGSRNKLGEAFVADLYESWKIHGIAAINKVCEERPHEYLKIIASILPKELHVKEEAASFDDMSDDELIDAINILRAAIAADGAKARH